MSRTFDPGSSGSLAAALHAAEGLRGPAAGEAARRIADARHPSVVSERFARELVARLDATES